MTAINAPIDERDVSPEIPLAPMKTGRMYAIGIYYGMLPSFLLSMSGVAPDRSLPEFVRNAAVILPACAIAGITNEPDPVKFNIVEKAILTAFKVGYYALGYKLAMDFQPTLNPNGPSTSAFASVVAITASIGAVMKNGANVLTKKLINRSQSL
jgi:hypothetical protein